MKEAASKCCGGVVGVAAVVEEEVAEVDVNIDEVVFGGDTELLGFIVGDALLLVVLGDRVVVVVVEVVVLVPLVVVVVLVVVV